MGAKLKARRESGTAGGRYEVLRSLGEGAFGTVVEARDLVTGEQVALKELQRTNPSAIARFKKEFRALQGTHHPNLVRLDQLFEDDGRWVIAMEHVPGTDWLSWVRPWAERPDNQNSAGFEIARLRPSLAALAQGLAALHESGFVHRDLKPSNVRVTPEGRVVLLDFGLVAALDPKAQSTQCGGLGTAAYMAPEQAAGIKVGPAADWYALGVCLYEALTGRLPFAAETALGVMLAKQGALPELPSRHTPCPADLESLCMALLEPDPSERAGQDEVSRLLQVEMREPDGPPDHTVAPTLGTSFAGREGELQALEEAFECSQQGGLQVVLVEGESGIGKSALVVEFLEQLQRRHPDAWILRSRCYENEELAYKAFDGCMDELARSLGKLPASECQRVLPAHTALLAQLFPVLGSVKAIGSASRDGAPADPTARRLEAFGAVSELLARIGLDRPLCLMVDDLQWADPESFRLLRHAADSSHCPPVLVICTVRPRLELDGEIDALIGELHARRDTRLVPVRGLPRSQARELVAQLLGPDAPRQWLQVIPEESRGHPLLISELVHYAASHDVSNSGALTLEAALAARVQRLDKGARALLELVALAGRPYPARLFARACKDHGSLREARTQLLLQKLIRTRRGEQLTTFHDKVREVVVELCGAARRPLLHRELAMTIAAEPEHDQGELARHWELAGEPDEALQAYERAADEALGALAFDRADRLYAAALRLSKDDAACTARLTLGRAHALARTGRSAEAAELYADAADRAEGEHQVRLRTLAAQHMIQGAEELERGMQAARSVLADLGIAVPTGSGGALARLGWERAVLRVRGLKVQSEGTPDLETRLVLDALAALSWPIGSVDMLAGAVLNARYLRLALGAGDAAHASRALSLEGMVQRIQHPDRAERAGELLARAAELAEASGDLKAQVFSANMAAQASAVALDHATDPRELERAHDAIQAKTPDDPWLLTSVRGALGSVWAMRLEHKKASTHTARWMCEAQERGDRWAHMNLFGGGFGFLGALMADDAEGCAEQLRELMLLWPREAFTEAHMGAFIVETMTLKYRGALGGAALMERWQPLVGRSFLMRTSLGRFFAAEANAGALLVDCAHASTGERTRLLAEARRFVATLRRLNRPVAELNALVLLAQIHALEGDLGEALAMSIRARQEGARFGMRSPAPHEYLEGLLEGGQAGQQRCDEVMGYFEQQGWADPLAGISMYLPCLPAFLAGRPQPPRRSGLVGDRYRVLRSLGAGGFGSVVQARDEHTGRGVALKELTRAQPSALARFKQEFRALQEVHHPSLVRLESLFTHRGRWFIAMQHVEGEAFLDWVSPRGTPNEERLRDALAQLVRALATLHDAGFLHRDVNPDNICVTPEGRVVLVDFGLVAHLDAEGIADAEAGVGTAAYMAPEQLGGQDVGAAADLYALGVCLYRALAGRLPFEADLPLDVVRMKQTAAPPPLADCPGVSSTLQALCMSLLARDPAERPDADRLLRNLCSDANAASSNAPSTLAPAREVPFAGREQELKGLHEHFQAACAGQFRLVLIEGESGLGKTTLVQHWLDALPASAPQALVLRSRCYENEEVPYKAFDGAVDGLAKVLRRLPPAECHALLPRRGAALGDLFPVLNSVSAIGQAPRKGLSADPTARRLHAFEALCHVLGRLCDGTPVVLVVDDLQWADTESFRVLRALFEDSVPLLVVCTVRPWEELTEDHRQCMQAAWEWNCTRMPLAGLPRSRVRELLAQLRGAEAPREWLEQIVAESGGHPLLVSELAEYVGCAGAGKTSQRPSLDAALRARIGKLDASARALLECIALAGRPCEPHVLGRAVGPDCDLDASIASLLSERFARVRSRQRMVCFHDRIRSVVVADLSGERRRELSRSLAEALAVEPDVDAAVLAHLWDEAARPDRACQAYQQAAEHAHANLAFARCADFYRRAIELVPEDEAQRWLALSEQRAHALAHDGRSSRAAELFSQCAERAEGERRVRLRLSAARHLVQSARVQDGMEAAQLLLRELGVPLPTSTGAALTRILCDRAMLALRGLEVQERPANEIPARDRLVLDALAELSLPVGWMAILSGGSLNTRHLRRALRAGDAAHVARALSQEATLRAMEKPEAKASYQPLYQRCRELCDALPDARTEAFTIYMEAQAGLYRNDFSGAVSMLERAQAILLEASPSDPWLLTNVRTFLGTAFYSTGDFRRLKLETRAWLDEARERDDSFSIAALTSLGWGFIDRLLQDRPDAAAAQLEQALAPWPRRANSLTSFAEFSATIGVESYRGNGAAGRWLAENRSRFAGEFFFKTSVGRRLWLELEGQCALDALSEAGASQDEASLKTARNAAAAAAKMSGDMAAACATELQAQIKVVEGDYQTALSHAVVARETNERLGRVRAEACRYLEGLLQGGAEGQQKCQAAEAVYRDGGWIRPGRALAMQLPVIAYLERGPR